MVGYVFGCETEVADFEIREFNEIGSAMNWGEKEIERFEKTHEKGETYNGPLFEGCVPYIKVAGKDKVLIYTDRWERI